MRSYYNSLIIGFAVLCGIFVSCSRRLDDNMPPDFHIELKNELFFDAGKSKNNGIALAICVRGDDIDYLKQPYILSIDAIYDGNIALAGSYYSDDETDQSDIVDEIDSVGSSLETIRLFEEGMIDRGYTAWTEFAVICGGEGKGGSFRLKLNFYETGEVLYTGAYTLIRELCFDGNFRLYDYKLIPGSSKD